MKKFRNKPVFIYLLMVFLFFACSTNEEEQPGEDQARADGATQLTTSPQGESSQNPAFSPDGQYILFTRFKKGYNEPPSELVKINLSTKEETVVIPAQEGVENTNVPGYSWVNGKICWSSDRAGESNEIYVANDDGTGITRVTNHPESEGYYIEPVFNPLNDKKILFEYGSSDEAPHRIAVVELDRNNRVTILTDGSFDDRLPNWSPTGQRILFQRASKGGEDWQIYMAEIDFSGNTPGLINVTKLSQPGTANTDNSWYYNGKYILSSTGYNSLMPNIFALPLDGGNPVRITSTDTNEDGAPSCSRDGKYVAFETHQGQDEEYPSEIWIIRVPDTIK